LLGGLLRRHFSLLLRLNWFGSLYLWLFFRLGNFRLGDFGLGFLHDD
jgi:hypothetical protein